MKKLLLLACASMMTVALGNGASKAALMDKKVTDNIIYITIDGKIEVGDDKKFHELTDHINEPEKIMVVLNSQGGNFYPGFDIADTIHLRGMKTATIPNGECHSMCAIIWVSGMTREVYRPSHISFHSVYNTNNNEVDLNSAVANALAGSLLGHVGLSYKAISWIMSAPSGSGHWLTPETAKEYGIAYDAFNEAPLSYAPDTTVVPKKVTTIPIVPTPAPASEETQELAYTTTTILRLWDRLSQNIKMLLPYGETLKAWSNEKCSWDQSTQTFWCPVYYGNVPGRVDARYVKTIQGEVLYDVLRKHS
jgi:ATP-dependent protease ClpP protease subunit